MRIKYWSLVALFALTACNPTGPTPAPNPDHRVPAPAVDPSANAKVGQDDKSALLHLDWKLERRFNIKVNDKGNVFDVTQRAQTADGGWFEYAVVLDPVHGKTVAIYGTPSDMRRQEVGEAHCWIRWNGIIIDHDDTTHGPVACIQVL